MSWSDVFPVLTDDQVIEYQEKTTADERTATATFVVRTATTVIRRECERFGPVQKSTATCDR